MWSSAYCTYDLIICIFEVKFDWVEMRDYVFHHVVGTLGAQMSVVAGRYMTKFAMSIMLVELSTFFMNMRWRLLKHKMTESKYFVASSVTFMFVFFVTRILYFPMLILRFSQLNQLTDLLTLHPFQYTSLLVLLVSAILLVFLQFWWFYLIVAAFVKFFTGGFDKAKAHKDR